MEEGVRRIKGNQIPDGVAIATIVGSEHPCSKAGCDSWKTIGIEVDIFDEEGDDVLVYSVCLTHLAEFVQDMFLDSYGFVQAGPPCDDPDCPIHGDHGDE